MVAARSGLASIILTRSGKDDSANIYDGTFVMRSTWLGAAADMRVTNPAESNYMNAD